MNELKEDERELIKLANFFKKRAKVLIEAGKLSEEHLQVVQACEKLTATIYEHSRIREEINQKRANIKNLIKDNASCPQCSSLNYLKFIGTDINEKNWKFNKYKCRRCNIQFVWNRPNNPWDMIAFTEEVAKEYQNKLESQNPSEEEVQVFRSMLAEVKGNLDLIKPIIKSSDEEFNALEARDKEITQMIKQFKNYLMIQKILMESSN